MREIIVLQIGQCGNQVGTKFWELIGSEHGLNIDGEFVGHPIQGDRINVYFEEDSAHKYYPRGIFLDLDPAPVQAFQNTTFGELVPKDRFFTGIKGSANNYATGFYHRAPILFEEVTERIRHMVEQCDLAQGFQMIHALGGGTGSGYGSQLLKKLHQEFPDLIMSTCSILPSQKVSDIVVEPYNAVLALNTLIESGDLSLIFDNQALYRICSGGLGLIDPRHADLNHLISRSMSGVTASFRFPGQLNSDLKKLHVNMVPFPRLHFFANSFVPLWRQTTSVPQMAFEVFLKDYLMVDCDPELGKFLTASIIFRGPVSPVEVEDEMGAVLKQRRRFFVEWIGQNIKTGICDISPPGLEMCATGLFNSTAMAAIFRRTENQFSKLLGRRAFLHWYLDAGMDEIEFTDSSANLRELIDEYIYYQNHLERTNGLEDEDDDD